MGFEVAVGALAVGAASGYMSAREESKAAKATARAQKLANAIEQRRADIENQRQRRLSAMQTVAGIASNEAYSAGAGTFSTTVGANTSMLSDFSSAIGASNTALAAQAGQFNALQKGADQAMRYKNRANNWAAVSRLSGGIGNLS